MPSQTHKTSQYFRALSALSACTLFAFAAEAGAAEPAGAERADAPAAADAPSEPGPSTSAERSDPAPATAPAAPTPPRSPAPTAIPGESTARVHVAVDYPNAWLELRSQVDATDWQRVCQAPCDRVLVVDGMEARVSAPGMTTSNVFRLEGGHGTARLRVNGGSSSARSTGLVLMIGGIPLSLGGFALLGYGRLKDSHGLELAGAATLGAGALSVLVSLPFLVSGSTKVRDAKGDTIANAPPALASF